MCLGIPMEILSIRNSTARCGRQGIERDVDIFLMNDQNLLVGDFVLVHVGYAIQKIEKTEAETRWQLIDQMQSLDV